MKQLHIDETNFIKEIRNKNPDALEFAVNAYGNLVYKIIYSVLNNTFEMPYIEECVSDIIETAVPLKSSYPIELAQGDFGKLVIEDVKTEKDRTLVTFYAQGIAPQFQADALGIQDEDGVCIMKRGAAKIIEKQKGNHRYPLEFGPLKDGKDYSLLLSGKSRFMCLPL